MNDIPLIYNTNVAWSRSGNTGGSYKDNNLDDEIMGMLSEGLVQRISYNAGYIYIMIIGKIIIKVIQYT
ncbi:hypothetical protein [Flavobacterium sp. PL002]|uniref:hypothetical protein n=1 Tax=Flavobacterium sp. PL002 TaxID=1897058 RepID=UPI001787F7B9|nr:hypothetical protein [Flavobacterium sp. PL002]MBE0393156.1 hypothetical protein [Flavobacterium sp. PL002]